MKRAEVAIGDIHGCFDELVLLLQKIRDYCNEQSLEEIKLIFLGDLVDRGPASAEVVELVRKMCISPAKYDFDVVASTCGNHEDMMLGGCESWAGFGHWINNGGAQTVQSYGGLHKIPDEHILFMEKLPALLRSERRYFVHAGLTPGAKIEHQAPVDCMWIREKFLHCREPAWDKHIVHGHSPRHEHKKFDQLENLKWRTNLDTGCFATGILSAAIFDADIDGEPVKFIQTEGTEDV